MYIKLFFIYSLIWENMSCVMWLMCCAWEGPSSGMCWGRYCIVGRFHKVSCVGVGGRVHLISCVKVVRWSIKCGGRAHNVSCLWVKGEFIKCHVL